MVCVDSSCLFLDYFLLGKMFLGINGVCLSPFLLMLPRGQVLESVLCLASCPAF